MNKIAYYIGLMTVFLLSGCSDKPIAEKFPDSVKTEAMLKTTDYIHHLKNLPALPEQQQKTINTIVESYQVFYGEKDYFSSPFKNKYAKEHQMKLRRDGDLEPVEGTKGRFSYSYQTILHDGSETELVYQHYNFGEDVYDMQIDKMSLLQCQYLKAYVAHQSNLSMRVRKIEYINGNKAYSETACEAQSDNTIIVISSDKMYRGNNYFSTFDNDIARFFNITQLILNKDYASAEKISYGKNLYVAPNNEAPNLSDFRLGIDYFINEQNNTVTIGAVKEDMCKYMVYHLPEATYLEANINEEKNCQKELNMITFKLKGQG